MNNATIDCPALPASCAAHRLPLQMRQRLAIDALAGSEPITHLADFHQVSRKFVYQQKNKAQLVLDEAFAAPQEQHQVLFHLPITKAWLHQLTLGLTLICHSSYRGVVELFRDCFDSSISVGNIHNIVVRAAQKAQQLNQAQDLTNVRIGANDEIFQNGQPVFTGVDVDSTYCYLLEAQDCRDGQTWQHSLERLKQQNFDPDAMISDAGGGVCKGQQLAMPEAQMRGDIFHALKDLTDLESYLERRAYDAITAVDQLRGELAKEPLDSDGHAQLLVQFQKSVLRESQAINRADSVALLARWWREDVFAVAGPSYEDRRLLYEFLLEQLRQIQPECEHRIKPVATMLKKQMTRLLTFAKSQDEDLQRLASEYQVSEEVLRDLLKSQTLSYNDGRRWQEEARLRGILRDRFYALSLDVALLRQRTVRASSVVENLNGRLRNYFFLRRQLGGQYLPLLQFFLNHRRFLRSEHKGRVDKSPAELLDGQSHPHWLRMLGYEPYSRN